MATGTTRDRAVRHDGWNAPARARFLEALARDPNVRNACQSAQRSHTTAYALRRRDPQFAADWAAALGAAMDGLFAVTMERAINGATRTVRTEGRPERTVHAHSDRLAMFLLARYHPSFAPQPAEPAPPPATSLDDQVDVCWALARAYHGLPEP